MSKEYYVNALRESKFKITPQRLQVIKFVNSKTPGHFTAEDVFKAVKKNEPTITLATVYNILKAMKDAGTINSFEANGTTWFETNHEFHGNFICRSCGEILDIPVSQNLIREMNSLEGFSVEDISLVLSGVCDKCANIQSVKP
ncbi:Fur family transcriptional regulator [Oxyplasma meridianum]|uniref:Fur family transcriptional regulator n=1 Tax=Oxyplasma meridianum TaxID=3073602 RepID=A0AAX4NIW6_9ARCH